MERLKTMLKKKVSRDGDGYIHVEEIHAMDVLEVWHHQAALAFTYGRLKGLRSCSTEKYQVGLR